MKPIKELLEFSIINIDKPAKWTSFDVCNRVRHMLKIKKAGHFGTLDPLVTGVLPISLNRACKLSNYFMKKDKLYIGKMYIHKKISKQDLEKEMGNFLGKISQKPPKKSRVKRVERIREVKKFKIIKITDVKDKKGVIVDFESEVQAGTYIRKLISDLGEKIGGAHMIELRRTKAGLFKIQDSITLEQLEKAFKGYEKGNDKQLRKILIPAEIIKQLITSVNVKEESIQGLLNGKPLFKTDLKSKLPNSDLISVFHKEQFLGIYRIEKEEEIIAKPEFVKN